MIHASIWFTENFPAKAMVSELCLRRGSFDRLSRIVRIENPDEHDWKQVLYILFELPKSSRTLSERVKKMLKLTVSEKIPWLQTIPQIPLDLALQLLKILDDKDKKSAEGLILHRADLIYHSGRSDALLKIKPLQDEEETVIETHLRKGKLSGMVSALVVKDKSSHIFPHRLQII